MKKYHNIFEAIEQDDMEGVRAFLPKHLNDHGYNGITPLHSACYYGNAEMAKMLIDSGADVNAANLEGGTPLRDACVYDSLELVDMLIQAGADVNRRDTEIGNTPLFHMNSIDVAKALINAGADVNARNDNGSTPLHCACVWAGLDVIKLLVESGAELNAQSVSNNTALHYICEATDATDFEAVYYLVKAGARYDIKNNKGETALDVLKQQVEYMQFRNVLNQQQEQRVLGFISTLENSLAADSDSASDFTYEI